MAGCALGLLAGVLAVLLAPALATAAGLAAITFAGLAALLRRRMHWLACFCAGFLLCHAVAMPQLARRQVQEERLLLLARIVSLPVRDGDLLRFDAELSDPRGRHASQRARIAWRLRGDARFLAPTAADHWQLALKLRAPRATVNPGTVDVERGLFRDRVNAVAEVIDSPLNRRLAQHPRTLLALRARIVQRIDAVVQERSAAALLAALAVGATGDVSREQWRIFNATGITHLVAISGLHVTLFAWLAMCGTAWLWRRAALLGLRLRRDCLTAVAGVGAALGYSLLAGFSVPTQRTLVMLALFLLWRGRARVAPMRSSLALSLVVVLLLDPFAPLGAGLWLSFGAVAAILLTAGTRLRPSGKIAEFLLLQFWVTLALLPLTLAVFGSVSLAGLLVNIGAIPFFSLLLVPLVLGAVGLQLMLPEALHSLPDLLLRLGAWLIDTSWPGFAAAADWDFSLWRASPADGEFLLVFAALGIVLCAWPFALRLSAVLLLIPLASATAPPRQAGLDISVLDVGHGLAVLVRTRSHALLYGTGDTFRTAGAPAERVVVPYAVSLGIEAIDLLVMPRVSIDVGAGVTALRAQLRIGDVLAGGEAQGLPPEFRACPVSAAWSWDGVHLELQRAANGSCVLRVDSSAGALLLTGDIDATAEGALLDRGVRAASIVIIPRQAAATASSPAFVQQVAAEWAIASVRAEARDSAGYARVSQRWRAAGARVLDTASSGALRLRLAPGAPGFSVESARARSLGLWRVP